jgi:hypothetical protein
MWNVYYYNILSGKNKYYAEEIYIHTVTQSFLVNSISYILALNETAFVTSGRATAACII